MKRLHARLKRSREEKIEFTFAALQTACKIVERGNGDKEANLVNQNINALQLRRARRVFLGPYCRAGQEP